MDKNTAHDDLHTVERAQILAERHSQNNGVVLLVWGVVVAVGMAGFDLFPFLAARWGGPDAAIEWGPLSAALWITLLALSASVWSQRYVRDLPVRPDRPGNRWLWVRPTGRVRCANGVWVAWHILVLVVGITAALYVGHKMGLRAPAPFAMTLTGFVDAAPLLVVGGRAWRRTIHAA